MMECSERQRGTGLDLIAYAAGRLDPQRRSQVEAHLQQCAACRSEYEQQAGLWAVLEEWAAPPVSEGVNRALYARIEQEAQSAWWRRLFGGAAGPRWRHAFTLATASVVLVAVLLFNIPGTPPSHPQPKAESVDIEQVERSLEDMEMLQQLSPVAKAEKAAVGESL